MSQPLMPMATAVWLIENTSLTFRQIAKFCGLHVLEVQAIADESTGAKVVGIDPVQAGQLDWETIERCQQDPKAELALKSEAVPSQRRTKGPRYTPVSKRQDKPDAIAWLLRNHPELSDAQVSRLIGTTKTTIEQIRDKSHWNAQNIRPQDPVALGLCRQSDLDEAVRKAAKRKGVATPSVSDQPIPDFTATLQAEAEAAAAEAAAAELADQQSAETETGKD